MEFTLDFLTSYDEASLLSELRRVAALVAGPSMSRAQFDKLARVHSSTLERKFGSWKAALAAAGLAHRLGPQALRHDKPALLETIKRVAREVAPEPLTLLEFSARTAIGGVPIRRCFGNWATALEEAGLVQSSLGKRYTDEQCFENMLALWSHYGRAPQHDEANAPPSTVGAKAYVRRWGTWRKALAAFVERVSATPEELPVAGTDDGKTLSPKPARLSSNQPQREAPLALRYFILKRDRFRCVACGRSPATHPQLHLHVDHVIPWVAGGRTVTENLRALCNECNLGKGATHASEA